MKPKMTEKQLTDQIIDWLNSHGFIAWKHKVGEATYENKDGSVRKVKYGIKGQSDIFAFSKGDGRFYAIEVKLPGKMHTLKPWQEEWINTCNFFGAVGMAVDSIESLEEQLLAL